ncbi:hypothetical protein A3K34_03080 [candidate division WWE3 bacterium RIFOXYC1_FULL_40_10]|uniref:Glycosyltransferase 2-like domain-containing protein n=1 Tax=candidate division WWE3 bacterium RIFOXYA2_FULL_46_9 TaxID=1802636 RepID=A0A1F4W0P6_UNCKA|nr:MAG: hypothetical protein A3K58_03080 [candidate division WWE3 bacterium RIFOXYB1_FULL_40_22]OGC61831.1 MAG: hypothetical protein A3K37_03080 [candidate division WWE3 bacterium RIFOXYA1_FULL_40_11]OGC62848.1 MAG: hypothetical protein A2264_04240 [candidate division WWE3 bacterium RIFOXYA2_FULL_46_9]OGC64303.1 MAG: hypothetical protein A2326_00495 [candidate division WWE3 bacterium RIFOXYB2_FULL_41_6]OGC66214.1 MAG: hypothetical protein A3K34_03080 [candidate division WWE3 bacterium RIFOXYC1_
MSSTRWDYEIIVVVDGNVDNTLSEAKKVKNDKVIVVGYNTNRGKGYAVRYGMARASGDYIAFIDSGFDINPNGISMVLEHMIWYQADIIVASKRHPASKVKLTPMRKLYSWGYHALTKALFSLKVRDTQAGLKVFKREVLEKVLPRLIVKAFAFDIELLAVAQRLGFKRIYEAPVELELDIRENSKFNQAVLIFNPSVRQMIKDTLAVFYRLHILHYYDDKSKRKWIYDKELDMRINTGEFRR